MGRFFDRAFAMFCITGLDGTVLNVNKRWQQVLSYSIEEVEGRSFFDFVHPDDLAQTQTQMNLQSHGGEMLMFENRYRCRDESWRTIEWAAVTDLEEELVYVTARDVTDRNEMEFGLRAAQVTADGNSTAKSDFLARMSHELRTPLNSVIGFADLIVRQGESMPEKKRDRFARNIRSSGHHLLSIVNDLLDLSKVESGRMDLAYSEFSPFEAIEQAVTVVAPMAERKGVRIVTESHGSTRQIEADRTKVVQVLYNLMTNAVKFTDTGGAVTVSVTMDDESEPPMVVFAVTDDGIGIAARDMDRIFRAFEQIDTVYVREQEGTGLGLALSRRLAEMHGGTVSGDSSGLGHGSTFKATFRAVPPLDGKEDSGRIPASDERPLVMVVEDTPQAAELVVEYLDVGGYRSVVVSDGASAVERARRLKPAAITLDILVPGSNGWQILRDLRSDPELNSIPVIVASVVDDKRTGFELGAVGYLVKPVSNMELLRAIERFVPAGQPRTCPGSD